MWNAPKKPSLLINYISGKWISLEGIVGFFENFEVFVTSMPNFIYVQNSLKSQIDHVSNALSLTQIIWDQVPVWLQKACPLRHLMLCADSYLCQNWKKKLKNIFFLQKTGFGQVLEIQESPWISRIHIPGLESPGILMQVLEGTGNLKARHNWFLASRIFSRYFF